MNPQLNEEIAYFILEEGEYSSINTQLNEYKSKIFSALISRVSKTHFRNTDGHMSQVHLESVSCKCGASVASTEKVYKIHGYSNSTEISLNRGKKFESDKFVVGISFSQGISDSIKNFNVESIDYKANVEDVRVTDLFIHESMHIYNILANSMNGVYNTHSVSNFKSKKNINKNYSKDNCFKYYTLIL